MTERGDEGFDVQRFPDDRGQSKLVGSRVDGPLPRRDEHRWSEGAKGADLLSFGVREGELTGAPEVRNDEVGAIVRTPPQYLGDAGARDHVSVELHLQQLDQQTPKVSVIFKQIDRRRHGPYRVAPAQQLCWLERMRLLRTVALLCPLLLLAAPAPTHSQAAWTTSTDGQQFYALALDPNDEQHLLASGARGVYGTFDGGASWPGSGGAGLGGALSFAPLEPGVVYGTSVDNRLFKSTDSGVSWSPIFTASPRGHINDVVADPNIAGAVYASGTEGDLAQVWRSTDGGSSWTSVLPLDLRGAGGIGETVATPVTAVPALPGFVLAGARYYHAGGVLASLDGGGTWSLAYDGALTPLAGASALAASSNVIYDSLNVQQAGSLLRSDDGGVTWSNLTDGLPLRGPQGSLVLSIALDPSRPDRVIIAQADISVVRRTGVFVSDDRGQTWSELGHLDQQVAQPHGLALAAGSQTLHAATSEAVWEYSLSPVATK